MMNKIIWKEYCEVCDKETDHILVDWKPGYKSVGLLGSEKIECEECRFNFWT